MIGTLATLPALKSLVMVSERVTLSMVGTKAADDPKVRFWKILYGQSVSSYRELCSSGVVTYPLDAVYLVILA
jgi:hypothetical protein